METGKKIILFDGICNLCNRSVIFIIEHEKNDVFRFASQQSDIGINLVNKLGIDTTTTESIILIEGDTYFTKSSAALRIARHLNGLYPLLYGCMVLPALIRDPLYEVIAKNRYAWFGKRESCMVPAPQLKAKFLHK